MNSIFCFPCFVWTVKSSQSVSSFRWTGDGSSKYRQNSYKQALTIIRCFPYFQIKSSRLSSSLLLHEMNKTRSSKYIRNLIQPTHDDTFPTFSKGIVLFYPEPFLRQRLTRAKGVFHNNKQEYKLTKQIGLPSSQMLRNLPASSPVRPVPSLPSHKINCRRSSNPNTQNLYQFLASTHHIFSTTRVQYKQTRNSSHFQMWFPCFETVESSQSVSSFT